VFRYPRVYSSIQIGEAANSELLWQGNNKFGSLWQLTVLGVLQTEQVTLTFVSGIWAEGSVMLETLKVFMQFLQS